MSVRENITPWRPPVSDDSGADAVASRTDDTSAGRIIQLVPVGEFAHLPAITLSSVITVIGSCGEVQVRLRTRSVSRVHAMILDVGDRLFVRDLASRTHVYVNGRLTRQCELHDGDQLQIGKITLRVSLQDIQPNASMLPQNTRAKLWRGDGAIMSLDGPMLLIGKRADSDLVIDANHVAPAHAVICTVAGEWLLRDLGSRFGTRLNDRPVEHALLRPGDVIEIGETTLQFDLDNVDSHGMLQHITAVAEPTIQAPDSSADDSERVGRPDDLEELVQSADLVDPPEIRQAPPALKRIAQTSLIVGTANDADDDNDSDNDSEIDPPSFTELNPRHGWRATSQEVLGKDLLHLANAPRGDAVDVPEVASPPVDEPVVENPIDTEVASCTTPEPSCPVDHELVNLARDRAIDLDPAEAPLIEQPEARIARQSVDEKLPSRVVEDSSVTEVEAAQRTIAETPKHHVPPPEEPVNPTFVQASLLPEMNGIEPAEAISNWGPLAAALMAETRPRSQRSEERISPPEYAKRFRRRAIAVALVLCALAVVGAAAWWIWSHGALR